MKLTYRVHYYDVMTNPWWQKMLCWNISVKNDPIVMKFATPKVKFLNSGQTPYWKNIVFGHNSASISVKFYLKTLNMCYDGLMWKNFKLWMTTILKIMISYCSEILSDFVAFLYD